jgi:REP element-mobilizing transposase RayT
MLEAQSFEHRKPWVEARILELGEIFACGIYAWAVMSNHLHLVVHMNLQASGVKLHTQSVLQKIFSL